MREQVVVYDPADGKILWHTQLPVPEEQSYLVIDGSNPPAYEEHYVVEGEFVDRPGHGMSIDTTEIDADGMDVATVSNVPAGTIVRVNEDDPVTVDDGSFELDSDYPDTFVIDLTPPFPTRAATYVVTAT